MLPERYNFTLLQKFLSLKAKRNEKFFIFASSYRQPSRSFFTFEDKIGVATEAACSLTGLFLFHKPPKDGLLHFRDVYHRTRPQDENTGVYKRFRQDLFWGGRQRLRDFICPDKRRMGGTEGVRGSKIFGIGGMTSINLMEAVRHSLSQNRNKGGWKGTTIPPKSLLNHLYGRQHYPGGAYADTPSALMQGNIVMCQRGCAYNFLWGLGL